MSKTQAFPKSFKFASNGIKEAFKNEPNFRIHLVLALLSLLFAFFFQLPLTNWIILILTISFVITLELLNTCIEKIIDITSPNYSDKAKIIKDVSAAAVLISAIAAALVGLLLFLPYILRF